MIVVIEEVDAADFYVCWARARPDEDEEACKEVTSDEPFCSLKKDLGSTMSL